MTQSSKTSSKTISTETLIKWMNLLDSKWSFRTVPSTSAALGHYVCISLHSDISDRNVDTSILWFGFRGDGVPILNYMNVDETEGQSVLIPSGWDASAAFSAVMTCSILKLEKLDDLLPYTRGVKSLSPTQEEKTRLRSKIQNGFRRESFQRDRGPFPPFLSDILKFLSEDYEKILDLEIRKLMSDVEVKMKLLAASGVDERAIVELWRGVLVREAMEA